MVFLSGKDFRFSNCLEREFDWFLNMRKSHDSLIRGLQTASFRYTDGFPLFFAFGLVKHLNLVRTLMAFLRWHPQVAQNWSRMAVFSWREVFLYRTWTASLYSRLDPGLMCISPFEIRWSITSNGESTILFLAPWVTCNMKQIGLVFWSWHTIFQVL